MATVVSCTSHDSAQATIHPKISLTSFLARLGNVSTISTKLNNYVLYNQEQVLTTDELDRKYIPMKKGNKWFRLYCSMLNVSGEDYAYEEFNKCRYFCKPKEVIEADELLMNIFIIPHYNDFCRKTLRPYTKTVMRQLFKMLAYLQKRADVHKNIRPESITWRWNKMHTKPRIYLRNFDDIQDGDLTPLCPYLRDLDYDICEYDVRLAGVLMLELLLDKDIYPKYQCTNGLIPRADREHYYTQIGCIVTCDLLEKLIGGSPMTRITAEQALKHKYFRSKHTV